MPGLKHALDLMEGNQPADAPLISPALCVLFGEDWFLRRQAHARLCALVLGAEADEAPLITLDPAVATWRDVADELGTRSLFGGGRKLVQMSGADGFVSKYRDELERWAVTSKPAGTLLLEVDSWLPTTRLYKCVEEHGQAVDCRAPQRTQGKRKVLDETRVLKWLQQWGEAEHHLQMTTEVAREILQLVGAEFGRLHLELQKLVLYAHPHHRVTRELVHEAIGGWRGQTTWELTDAAAEGNAADALRQLDRLLQAGESAQMLFGGMSWALRRFADATRDIERQERQGTPVDLRRSLERAGVRPWPRDALELAERQLRQLGRQRAGQLHHWLLEADLALKGTHSAPARSRWMLERLLVLLSRQTRPATAVTSAAAR